MKLKQGVKHIIFANNKTNTVGIYNIYYANKWGLAL
jgi:hypothetical protein